MSNSNLCAVILAAGNSSRFGSNKLLYKINNKYMYQYTIDLIKRLNPKVSIIVTKYPEILSDKNINDFIIVENHLTNLGQSHSLKLAIEKSLEISRLSNLKFDGYLFLVSDQPYLSFNSLQKLYITWQKKRGICALSYNKKRKTPVIFSAKYLDELLQVTGDKGGRDIILNHLDELTLVEVSAKKELIDIDNPTILNQLD